MHSGGIRRVCVRARLCERVRVRVRARARASASARACALNSSRRVHVQVLLNEVVWEYLPPSIHIYREREGDDR